MVCSVAQVTSFFRHFSNDLRWEVAMSACGYQGRNIAVNSDQECEPGGKSSTFCLWKNFDGASPAVEASTGPFHRGRGQEDFPGYEDLDDDFDDEFDDDFDMEFDDDGFEDRFEDEEEEELGEEETSQEDLDTDVPEEDEDFDDVPAEDFEEDPPLEEELD
jgi:hypothetical protein